MSVASAKITDDIPKARTIARYRAVRTLLEHYEGIRVYAAELLQGNESLMISIGHAQYQMISQFLSVQKEQVTGEIKSFPVVVVWMGQNS